MRFKLPNAKYITEPSKAVEYIVDVLAGDEIVTNGPVEGTDIWDTDFWDDIIEFCAKWEIPFNKELHQKLVQIRINSIGKSTNDWDSSEWESS
jgi:hypothetical protein